MKVAILGTENSHADAFLDLILHDPDFSEIELVGIYGYDDDANNRLIEKGFKGTVADNPHEFLGKVDAVLVTARHGDHHYEYALPYVEAGIPAFIDKPFCVDLNKAEALVAAAKKSGAPLSGGSSIRFLNEWEDFPEFIKNNEVVGATVTAPVNMVNEYGGYYFYSQHLAETMVHIFGENAKSVIAYCPDEKENRITAIYDYGEFDITAHYYKSYAYSVSVYTVEGGVKSAFTYNGGGAYKKELAEFYEMAKTGVMPMSFERLLKPLKILHATEESFKSGKRVVIE